MWRECGTADYNLVIYGAKIHSLIVSPSTSSYDYITKLSKYKTAGVREYWIVNPLRQIITVYLFNEKDIFPQTYDFKDKIRVSIFNDLVIDFCELDI